MIQGQNFQFEDPADFLDIQDGETFVKCNLDQKELDTVIMAGKKNLKFVRCNMENVLKDSSWKTDGMCRSAKSKTTLEPFNDGGNLTTKEVVTPLGRYGQINLLSMTEMKDIARKITHPQMKDLARGKSNDISKFYKAKPLSEITLEVE